MTVSQSSGPATGLATDPSSGQPTDLASASVAEVDPEVWAAIEGERHRQHDKIELIASENYVYKAVLEAQGSWLTNKYAEGLPGKRYYGGCEFVDVVERLAQDRALALFPGSEHVNVQPHSGAQANMAAYLSSVNPGDRVLGMNLAHGGHLTHGMALNFSGRYFEIHAYGVREDDQRIDYDALERQAHEVRPKLIVGGASAYPRIIDFERMADIAHAVGALLWVDMAHVAGLVAAGLHPSPFPHADIVTTTNHKTLRGARGGMIFSRNELPPSVDPADYPMVKPTLAATIDRSVFPGIQGGPLMHVIAGKAVALRLAQGEEFREYQRRVVANARVMGETLQQLGARLMTGGTDNHLVLVDVTPLGVTGREAERLLDEIGITVNKNAIPFDTNPPNIASGIRIGSPATTSRGFGEDEMRAIAGLIVAAIAARDDPRALAGLVPRRARSPTASRSPGCPRRDGPDPMHLIGGLPELLPAFIVAFVAAAVISFLLTPLVRGIARRINLVDEPNHRRVNTRPIARGGGMAVVFAFLIVGLTLTMLVAAGSLVGFSLPPSIGESEVFALFGGTALAALIGLLDDVLNLRARWQLVGQLALAAGAVLLGITIDSIANPFGPDQIPLDGIWGVAFTVFWIIGMINSINWIDGLDGLSSGIGVIAAFTLGLISLTVSAGLFGQPYVALMCFVLAGSLLGFLRWNFHPATIFVGTSGVMVIGYSLAVLSILGTAKVAVALLVLGVPIIDTFWNIVRRLATGASPFTPDRGHVHHRLMDVGMSQTQVVLVIYGLTAVLAVLSFVLSGAGQLYAFLGVVVASGVLLLLVTRRSLVMDDFRAESYEPDERPAAAPPKAPTQPPLDAKTSQVEVAPQGPLRPH